MRHAKGFIFLNESEKTDAQFRTKNDIVIPNGINPNKNGGGEKLITKYSEFVDKMSFILDSLGADLSEYDVIRADFCFNSTDKSTYDSYQKLHRLLISCLAKAYKYKNCYVSLYSKIWKK